MLYFPAIYFSASSIHAECFRLTRGVSLICSPCARISATSGCSVLRFDVWRYILLLFVKPALTLFAVQLVQRGTLGFAPWRLLLTRLAGEAVCLRSGHLSSLLCSIPNYMPYITHNSEPKPSFLAHVISANYSTCYSTHPQKHFCSLLSAISNRSFICAGYKSTSGLRTPVHRFPPHLPIHFHPAAFRLLPVSVSSM